MLKKAAGCVLAGHCRLTGDTARSPSRGRPQRVLHYSAWRGPRRRSQAYGALSVRREPRARPQREKLRPLLARTNVALY